MKNKAKSNDLILKIIWVYVQNRLPVIFHRLTEDIKSNKDSKIYKILSSKEVVSIIDRFCKVWQQKRNNIIK